MALEELRLRAKGANFSSARPRASLRVGRLTIVTAAISDFSPWGVNDIQSLFIVCLYIVTGFYQGTRKIHGGTCGRL